MVVRIVALLVVLLPAASAQVAVVDKGRVLAEARRRPLAPKEKTLLWMDWARVKSGLTFYRQNQALIDQVLATTSLVSTYAAKDVAPVLLETKRLERDYRKRLEETGRWVAEMLAPAATAEEFRSRNLRRAYELGDMHLGLSRALPAEKLGWRSAERVTFNQQAYAFVLYTFAWQPVESLLAMGKLEEYQDYDRIGDWLHLWCALGYAMGVEESLLPRSFSDARAYGALLRRAQYMRAGESLPFDVTPLLRGELQMLAGAADNEQALEKAVQGLSQMIHTSPGLSDALGLGKEPAIKLRELARK